MRPISTKASSAAPLQWLRIAFLALFALQGATATADQPGNGGNPNEPSARAKAVVLEGRIGQIIVDNRISGETRVYKVLEAGDGRRFLLRSTIAGALAVGAAVAVDGRADGKVLFADAIRPLTAAERQVGSLKSAAPTTPGELTGTLRQLHIDLADGTSEFMFSLVPDQGRRTLVSLGSQLGVLQNGMRVTVFGPVNADGYMQVERIIILAPPETKPTSSLSSQDAPLAAVTTNYMVLPLKFPTSIAPLTYPADPTNIAAIQNIVFGASPALSVAEYFKDVSYGGQLLAGTVAEAAGSVWLKATVVSPGACGTDAGLNAILEAIETQGETQAAAAGFPGVNWSSYSGGILYVVNSLPCGWLGLGYIGLKRAYTNNSSTLTTIGHELGHNFGLLHAGSLDCGVNVIATTGCSSAEYGDPFVIMGNSRAMHFTASQKLKLGYIGAGTVSTHSSGTTTYTLNPIELGGQASYAIKVPTSKPNRTYWIEFRQPLGPFDGAVSFPNNGAQFRVAWPFEVVCGGCSNAGPYPSNDTELLDMTPATGTFNDAALLVGQSFTDPADNIVFTVISYTPTALQVEVSKSGLSSTTTTVGSSQNPSNQGANVNFLATVTGSAVTGSVTFRDAGTPITGCSALPFASVAGNVRTVTCATTALAVGSHSITAAYSGDVGNGASTSSALVQSVTAPINATTTTLASSLNPSTVGVAVTFTATVNGTAPTGSVAFTNGGASIAGCGAASLTGSGNARTATCVTSALAQGSRTIVANYGGNASNGVSSSSPLAQSVNGIVVTATTTALSSAINPAAVGATVSIVASVTGVVPGGTVTFTEIGVPVPGCTALPLSGGGNTRTATCSTSSLPAGSHGLKGNYSGDGSNASSISTVFWQTIGLPGQAALPLYRFNTGKFFFYTVSEAEKNLVLQNYPTWVLEGIAYYVFPNPVINTSPVHRFNTGTYHFYTISVAEKAYVQATFPQWVYEGVAFYTYPGITVGTSPVYRFQTGAQHFYTISEPEKAYVLQTFPTWVLEGTGYYARMGP